MESYSFDGHETLLLPFEVWLEPDHCLLDGPEPVMEWKEMNQD